MRRSPSLWIMAEEDAEKLRRMSRSMRSPHKAALLFLGYQALRDFADYALRGGMPKDVVVRLQSLERLFKLHGLPSGVIGKYVRYARDMASSRDYTWFGWSGWGQVGATA
ncbi:MAG: hypothetical protein GSR84_04295 [Desulfurococcales archaeon]|nr:hypothetical protein [Desulfurococcales archaeon]